MTRKKILTPEKAAKEWIELRAEKVQIEKRIEDLKQVLEPYLEKQKDFTAELNGWKFALAEIEREYFKLKEARSKLDVKILKPFIEVSTYTQIRTTWKGGDESI